MLTDAIPCYGNNPLTVGFLVVRADARLLEVPATDSDILPGDLTAIVSNSKHGLVPIDPSLTTVCTYVAAQQQWRADLTDVQMAPGVWNALAAPLYLVLLLQGKAIGYAALIYAQDRDMLADA